jgi:hypothetical protein
VIAGLVFDVFTLFAFTEFAAFEASLEALAVFFLAVGFFTVATFGMLIIFDFRFETLLIPFHEIQYRCISFLLVLVSVVTAYAVTSIARLVNPETIAI